jgi:hypothetical protein
MRRRSGGGGKKGALAALLALLLLGLGAWLPLGTDRLERGFAGWPLLGRIVDSLRGRAPERPEASEREPGGFDGAPLEPGSGGSGAAEAAASETAAEPHAERAEPLPDRRPAREGGLEPFRGAVRDAATGRAIPGARLRATAYHGTEAPAFAGMPALRTVFAATDEDGIFEIEAMAPHDPRLLLHLQAEHPSYAPLAVVLKRGRRADGRWVEAEILLRRALALPVQIVDLAGSRSGRRQRIDVT